MQLLDKATRERLIKDVNHFLLEASAANDVDMMLDEALEVLKKPDSTLLVIKSDNGTIGIDQIRSYKKSLSLRHSAKDSLIIAIYQSQQMTTEAQNSILKLLEETPAGVRILMSATAKGNLLETIRSRLSHVRYVPPKIQGLNPAEQAVYKASGYSYSLIEKYRKSETDDLDKAKQWLSGSKSYRLSQIATVKEKQAAKELVEAQLMILYSLLGVAASGGDKLRVKNVSRSIDLAMLSLKRLNNGGNVRLNLTQLALNL